MLQYFTVGDRIRRNTQWRTEWQSVLISGDRDAPEPDHPLSSRYGGEVRQAPEATTMVSQQGRDWRMSFPRPEAAAADVLVMPLH